MAKQNGRGDAESLSLRCFTCQTRHQSEWCSLSDEDLALLDRSKRVSEYARGELVYMQGNSCEGVYCIEEGNVAVRRMDSQGNSVLLRLALPGQTLGYRDYFAGKGHTSSAEALAPARVCFVPGDALQEMLAHNPALGLQFLTHLAEDLDRSEEAILHHSALSVRTRLAHLLLALKERFADVTDDGTIELSLPLARQDLAALLGTRPETIARTISALETDAVAMFSGRTVRIPDLDLLLNEIDPYS